MGDGPDFSDSTWTDAKDTLGLDFPALPYLIDGDVRLTNPMAIMKYITLKYQSDENNLSD